MKHLASLFLYKVEISLEYMISIDYRIFYSDGSRVTYLMFADGRRSWSHLVICTSVISPGFAYGKTGREQVCAQPSIAEKPLHYAAAVTFWWSLSPFVSLLPLLTHTGGSSRAQHFCPWPWDRCLLLTPAHCSACWRKDSSRVVFLWLCVSFCTFWGKMGQLGRKKMTFSSNTVAAEEEPCLGLCWALVTRTRGGTLGKTTFGKRSWV